MPEADSQSEEWAQSHVAKGSNAGMLKANEDEEESHSTALFCVNMYASQQPSFQLKPQPQCTEWHIWKSKHMSASKS